MIKIVADSTCDLSQELLEAYGVAVLPLHVILGERDCLDGVDVTQEELLAWAEENRVTPKTSAPSVAEVMDLFRDLLGSGDALICFPVSESMSTTAQVMRLAAEELGEEDRIHVVDSANLSTGTGLLVLEAVAMVRDGRSSEEILADIEALKPRVKASFVVDTLTYLHRGGRCSGAAALAAAGLKLHPRISVRNGAMEVGKKYRGNMKHVILRYAKDLEPDLRRAKPDRVFLTHCQCSQETVDAGKAFLESLQHFREIQVTQAGSVIASHCGPGTLGILFLAGETGS